MTDKLACYVSSLRDPWTNLAVEEHILNRVDAGEHPPALVFYVNEPAVVVGKNNPLEEWVKLDRVESSRVPLLRRKSGGGTVVHHTDNLNFGLIFPLDMVGEDTPKGVQGELLDIVIDALSQMGINAEIARICDLVAHGKKIGGNGLWMSSRTVLEHGTLLFRARSVLMEHFLPIPPDRDEDVEHEDFVAGIHELGYAFMMEDFVSELIGSVEREFELETESLGFSDRLVEAASGELEELRERSRREH